MSSLGLGAQRIQLTARLWTGGRPPRLAGKTMHSKRGEAVADIVKAMGFTSANQFYRIYKRHFGHTIRQNDLADSRA